MLYEIDITWHDLFNGMEGSNTSVRNGKHGPQPQRCDDHGNGMRWILWRYSISSINTAHLPPPDIRKNTSARTYKERKFIAKTWRRKGQNYVSSCILGSGLVRATRSGRSKCQTPSHRLGVRWKGGKGKVRKQWTDRCRTWFFFSTVCAWLSRHTSLEWLGYAIGCNAMQCDA